MSSHPSMQGGHADQSNADPVAQRLPEPLPSTPWSVFRRWFDDAERARLQPNPNAMTLATINPAGWPSARIVLCKQMNLDERAGYFVFYTNRRSRKGRELEANNHAALVFHWDAQDRQARIEGVAVQSPEEESDAYFASRPLESRIAACASDQSHPIASREELLRRVSETVQRLGIANAGSSAVVPRPAHWGGYRVWAKAVELWVGGPGRVHDRARWERTLTPAPHGTFSPGAWRHTRLQP